MNEIQLMKEIRSRRYVSLFTPSLYNRLKSYATSQGRSVNDVITQAVEEFLKRFSA